MYFTLLAGSFSTYRVVTSQKVIHILMYFVHINAYIFSNNVMYFVHIIRLEMIVFFLTMVRNLGMRWWKKLRWLPGIGDWVSLCVNRFCSTNSNVIRLIVLRDKGEVFGCQCVVWMESDCVSRFDCASFVAFLVWCVYWPEAPILLGWQFFFLLFSEFLFCALNLCFVPVSAGVYCFFPFLLPFLWFLYQI
jgi:hypothetical protein